MEALFLKLVNMSITASYLVLPVLLFRVLLKKAPKSIRCVLWGLVGLRLVFPFSIESVLSLIPSAEPLPEEFLYAATPQVNTGIAALNNAINPMIAESLTPVDMASANPSQIWSFIFARVWLIGVIAMAVYALISDVVLRRRVRVSIKVGQNLHLCDHIGTPFILGIGKPQIYLPSDLDPKTADHVLAHEYAHIQRKDHWWKPLGFALLSVYWFNPVLWLAYILLCRDIEMACDEKVVKDLDTSRKKEYSEALLRCSVSHKRIAACPLAFGEVGVKSRIKSVLRYKKPAFWIILLAVIASITVGVCFLTDPAGQSLSALGQMDANEIRSISVTNGERTYEITSQGGIEYVTELIDETSVSRNEISKSRSENRNKFNTITVHFASTEWHYHFNESCTAVWLDDSVKPSFSYEVKNPERVLQFFESTIETQAFSQLCEGTYNIGTLVGQHLAISFEPETGDGKITLLNGTLTVTAGDGTVLYSGSNPTVEQSTWSEAVDDLTNLDGKQIYLYSDRLGMEYTADQSMLLYEFSEDGEVLYTLYCVDGIPVLYFDNIRLFKLDPITAPNRPVEKQTAKQTYGEGVPQSIPNKL